MPSLLTLAGERYEPDIPSRLLSIAGDIRGAGGRAFFANGTTDDGITRSFCHHTRHCNLRT